jgi:hypothetical protein
MRTHATFPIDKKYLCDSGCQRMAIYGLAVSEDGILLAEIKVCTPCLKEQVTEKEYQTR